MGSSWMGLLGGPESGMTESGESVTRHTGWCSFFRLPTLLPTLRRPESQSITYDYRLLTPFLHTLVRDYSQHSCLRSPDCRLVLWHISSLGLSADSQRRLRVLGKLEQQVLYVPFR